MAGDLLVAIIIHNKREHQSSSRSRGLQHGKGTQAIPLSWQALTQVPRSAGGWRGTRIASLNSAAGIAGGWVIEIAG